MTRTPTAIVSTLATALLVALAAGPARADTVVHIPLAGVLDTRGVTTLTNGTIVPFTLTIDGGGGDVGTGGLQNGFATKAVAMMKSPANVANSLPDDGHFPADTHHPDLYLDYSNDAPATSPQNHLVKPPVTPTTPGSSFSFPVPAATYSKLFLFFHGANGGTTVKITLTYSDATTDVTMATIPDFGSGAVPPANGNVFVLYGNLAKWSKTTTIAEGGNHNIFGAEVDPMAKTLSMVKVERGMTGYLVFWGATGVATSAVTPLPDAGTSPDAGAAGTGGAAGGGAGAGGAGTAGAAGAAGASGTAGASGGAGTAGTAGAAGAAAGTAGTTGTSGSSGTGTAGGAGTTAAGTAGAAGPHGSSGSGGCACRLAAADSSHASSLLIGAAIAWSLGRRRRRVP
jgi:hypothetical protein